MTATTVQHPATWTRQRARLWTGRADGHPIGTIEQGRRFRVVDMEGGVSRAFRTLGDAQHAAEQGAWTPVQRRWTAVGLAVRTSIIALSVVALSGVLIGAVLLLQPA